MFSNQETKGVFWYEKKSWKKKLAFLFQPEGSGSGAYQLSGTGIVTGISQSQSFDGLVERSFSVQGTGALTIGTV